MPAALRLVLPPAPPPRSGPCGAGARLTKGGSRRARGPGGPGPDDEADRGLFSSVDTWLEDALPHASAVMLPGGSMFGRVVRPGEFHPLGLIAVAGDDLHFW